MVDNFGPPYKRLTSLTEYTAAFNATPIERQMISSTWYKNKPILLDEQVAIVTTMMDGAGNLHNPMDTAGNVKVSNTYFSDLNTIKNQTLTANKGSYNGVPTVGKVDGNTSAAVVLAQPTLAAVNITLAAGVQADIELVPALAGYYGVIQPYALWSDTADEYVLEFQDEDNAALNPTNCLQINVEIKHANEASPVCQTHGAAGDNSGSAPIPLFFYGIADNKALELDVTGAGVQTCVLYYIYWYET